MQIFLLCISGSMNGWHYMYHRIFYKTKPMRTSSLHSGENPEDLMEECETFETFICDWRPNVNRSDISNSRLNIYLDAVFKSKTLWLVCLMSGIYSYCELSKPLTISGRGRNSSQLKGKLDLEPKVAKHSIPHLVPSACSFLSFITKSCATGRTLWEWEYFHLYK